MPRPTHGNRKELNLKLLGVLLLLATLVPLGVHIMHLRQVEASATVMLGYANQAKEEGKFDEAIRCYRYYVSYRPDDMEVYCQLALLEADQAKAHSYPPGEVAQVFPRLALAVARKPDDVDLLRSLAEMAMETGRLRQGAECYSRLVSTFPDNTEMKLKYARCLMATGDFRRAIEMLQDVLVKSPTTLSAYVTLSDLYRYRLNQARQADVVIEQMVAANPGSAQARFERARCRWRAGDRQLVDAELQAVMKLTPEDPDVLFFATEVATEHKEFARAQAIVDRAQKLYPNDLRVDQALIALKIAKGETEEAQTLIERFIQKQPDNSRALHILAELQLQRKDVAGVRTTIKQLLRAHFNRHMINLIESQALMQEGKWREASVLLEKLRLSFQNAPEYSRRIELFLGMCYESLGLPDRQREAFERLLKMDPGALAARLGLASALSRSRQSDRALEEYSRLLQAMGVAGFAQFQSLRNHYYQLRSAQIAALPPAERNWTELEQYVTTLEGIPKVDPVDTALMRIDLLVRQEKIEEAKKVLAASQKAFPQDSRLKNAAAGMVAQQSPKRAMEMLTENLPPGEDTVDLRLTRANLALRLGRERGVELLANLERRIDRFSEEQRRKLWYGLAAVYQQIGEIDQAKRLWRLVAAADPTDVRSRAQLFELGQLNNDEALMREALSSFAQAQGGQSAEWKCYQAAYLVWQVRARHADRQWLAAADKYLKQAKKLRPTWEVIPWVDAQIAVMEGRLDDATASFRKADELAPLTPVALGQYVRLLYVRGRYDEVRQLLMKLPVSEQTAALRMMAAELEMEAGNKEEAIKMASAIATRSEKPLELVWYGQMLAKVGRNDDAERTLRHAVGYGIGMPETWLALISQLTADGKIAEVRETLRLTQVYFAEDRVPLILAQAYETLGDYRVARDYYFAATALTPDDFHVIHLTAAFLLKQKSPDEAVAYLVKMIQVGGADERNRSAVAWARRSLARMLIDTGGYAEQEQAIELLDANAVDDRLTVEELRLKAAVYMARPWPQAQLTAIRMYEQIRKQSLKLDPDDQFRLAVLYEKVGRWDLCQSQMQVLVRDHQRNVRYLSTYLGMMLDHGDKGSELDTWLKKLEAAAPKSDTTWALKARCLARRNEAAEAVTLLTDALPKPEPEKNLARFNLAVQTLEKIEQFKPAQELLAGYASRSPAGKLAQAAFAARRGELPQALDLCQAVMKSRPYAEVVPTAVGALKDSSKPPRPEDYSRVQGWFDQWQRDGHDAKLRLQQWVAFLERQGKYPELILAYRKLLACPDVDEQERANLSNRLVYLMAFQKTDPKTAVELIDKAIDILGPSPLLRETRGLALWANGQSRAAVEELQQTVQESPSGRVYFHLALALAATNDLRSANRAIELARDDRQFSPNSLPPLERRSYQELLEKLSTM